MIVDPAATLELPAGLWSMTLPSGALVVVWLVVLTTKPALLSCDLADDSFSPITLGTETIGLPEEKVRSTAVPGSTYSSRLGLWSVTTLRSAVWLGS